MMPPDWQQPQAAGGGTGLAAMVLSRSALFAGWSPDALAYAAQRFVPRAIPSGALLCRQGDPGDEMFVIERGRFAVDAVINGRSVRFAELGAGAVVGEIAVLTLQPRSATVTALVDGHVWALHRTDFDALTAQFQGLEQAAGRIAAERIAQQQAAPGTPRPSSPEWQPPSPEWRPSDPRAGGRWGAPQATGGAQPWSGGGSGGIQPSGGSPSWSPPTMIGRAYRDGGAPLANEPITLALRPTQEVVTIGRDDGNDLVLRDPRVSRRHALVRRVGQSFRIEDLGSTNGIFVNGRRVDRADLQPGDLIQVGAQSLRFDPAVLTQYARGRGAQVDAVGLSKVVSKGLSILSNVSLSVYPGELVAIVGGSGAGKTTLLNALAGVGPPTAGRVLYDGDDYYLHFQAYRQVLGYVPQDDIVHPELSVYRTLYYAARLRLPSDTSRDEIDARITHVLNTLELSARRDTEVRKLSGGQRKRVSIGVELLTEPEVFYLDEPTSGLDPGLDLRMMELLRGIADQGRTVILTTHATRNVMLCDKVAFMARGGHLAFFGPPADALRYFNVADFVDIYRLLDPDGVAEQAAARFLASEPFARHVAQRQDRAAFAPPNAPGPVPDPGRAPANARPSRAGPGWLPQLFWLTLRYLAVLKGDRVALAVLFAAAPVSAVMLSGTLPIDIFEMSRDDGGNARQALSLLFMLITSSILLGGFVASRSIAEEGAIYARERLVNLQIAPYVLSKALVLGLFSVVQSAFLVFITAGRIEIPGGADALRDIYLVVLAANLISVAAGLFASAVASNGLQATLMIVIYLMVQLAIAGGIVPLKGMDAVARAMSMLTPGRWALSLLGRVADINARMDAQFPKNNFVDQFTVEPSTCWGALGGIFVGLMILAVIALKRRDVQ